jgi:hypothetical protein
MKQHHYILGIIIFFLMLLSLVSCHDVTPTPTEDTTRKRDTVDHKKEFWIWHDRMNDSFQKANKPKSKSIKDYRNNDN